MSALPSVEQRDIPLKLGFLGVGWIGRHRMQAILETGLVSHAIIADASEEAVAAALETCRDAATCDGLEALLEQNLDGIVIATPSALHADQCIRALENGLAVFCQKPLGRNAGEVRQVVDAARQADRLLAVDLSYRETAAMQAIRQLIRSGDLGEIFAVNLVFHNAYGPDKPWFHDRALSGGGCLIDLGIHLVDLAMWLLDYRPVERVASRLMRDGRPLSGDQVETFAAAQFELAGGPAVQLSCSWNLPAGQDAVIAASFYGTKGGAELRNVEGSFYDFVALHMQGTSARMIASPPDDWGGRAAAKWARKLSAGHGFDDEASHLVMLSETLDALYAAAST